jgi:hypothetical protein
LQFLPKTLDTTYDQALLRIRSQAEEDVELAEAVLLWVLCARRTLTVLELQHMYAMRALSEGEEALQEDDLPDADILTGVCGGLITVDGESKMVRFVHYTTQQYFERAYKDHSTSTTFEITRLSLAYLRLPNFSTGICTTDAAMSSRLEQYPFLHYAARHWGSEGSNVDFDALWADLTAFVSNKVAVDVASQVWSLPQHRYTHWSQEFPRNVPFLVLAASFDIPQVLRRLVADDQDLEGRGSDGGSPLIRAASLGLAANVTLLIELGAEVNSTDSSGETALERAAASGNEAIVKALLGGGAEINLKSAAGWTVLMSAVRSGNMDIVKTLVRAGADLRAETAWGDSALSLAAKIGQEDIAIYLADSGAILPNNVAGRRASIIAARKGLRSLVRRLTVDYSAVARRGLQRQELAPVGGLAGITEGQEESDVVLQLTIQNWEEDTLDKNAIINDVGEAVDGLDYTRGFLRRYDLIGKIGKGHSAEVFLCASKVTGVKHAVKIFSAPGTRDTFWGARKEILFLRALRHQNIIRLIDVMIQDTMATSTSSLSCVQKASFSTILFSLRGLRKL